MYYTTQIENLIFYQFNIFSTWLPKGQWKDYVFKILS
jgi:hypothetical protein